MDTPIYDPRNPLSAGFIRLLTLFPAKEISAPVICELHPYSLDSAPQYEALSYAWGEPNFVKPIRLQNQEWLVTEILDSALRNLRLESEERLLWIDALCIDQTSDKDKRHQISQMGQVYKIASRVLVWLGEGSKNTSSAIEAIDLISKDPSLHWYYRDGSKSESVETLIQGRFDGNFVAGFSEIMSNSWWERVWTLQEAILAQKLVFFVGQRSFSIQSFSNVPRSHVKHGRTCCKLDIKLYIVISAAFFNLSELTSRKAKFANYHPEKPYQAGSEIHQKYWHHYLSLLNSSRRRECILPQDRIYGTLGLSPIFENTKLIKDYSSSVHKVFADFQLLVIQSIRSLEIFNFLGPFSIQKDVSWLVEWEVPVLTGSDQVVIDLEVDKASVISIELNLNNKYEGKDRFNASMSDLISVQHLDSRVLILPGVVFDKITYVDEEECNSLGFRPIWEIYKTCYSRLQQPYAKSGTTSQAFFETLMAYCEGSKEKNDQEAHLIEHQFSLRFELTSKGDTLALGPSENSNNYEFSTDTSDFRKFVSSEKGYIGWANMGVEPGDLICILYGSRVPIILRESPVPTSLELGESKSCYKVVGDSYIHGIMHGEALDKMEEEGLFKQEFYLI